MFELEEAMLWELSILACTSSLASSLLPPREHSDKWPDGLDPLNPYMIWDTFDRSTECNKNNSNTEPFFHVSVSEEVPKFQYTVQHY